MRRQVARGAKEVGVIVAEDDQRVLQPNASSAAFACLVLASAGRAIRPRSTSVERAIRNRHRQRLPPRLLGHLVRIVARQRSEDCPAMPPDRERVEPERARPVPFCRHGFLPPPAINPRVLVEAVPERRLANCIRTASCSSELCPMRPNTAPDNSNSPGVRAGREQRHLHRFDFCCLLPVIHWPSPPAQRGATSPNAARSPRCRQRRERIPRPKSHCRPRESRPPSNSASPLTLPI